ncbi:MAG: LPS assembly protein LptD [Paracoccaceae bacterium]
MRPLAHALTALFLALAAPAAAQERASMVADTVAINGDDTLTATGHVEVFYKGRRLTASRIDYDRKADSLKIAGPIVLTDTAGETVVLADQAALDADLANGVMTGVRMVMDRQLQLAAAEMQRIDGRYTQLSRTVASSCKVCAGNPAPLWEIRARKVVHDELAQQIYFTDAQFRIAGLPVFWVPRLRMPDPNLDRSSGFLRPELRTTTGLGTGLKLPYFVTLGRSADVTLTPYVSTKNGRTLELRYRQAFRTGEIELNGAVSHDELLPGETRGYLTADGHFALPYGFTLKFHGETVSDDAYLYDYGLPEEDRLESVIEATRVRRNEYISARLVGVQSIREGESNSTIPSLIGDFTFHRRFSGGPLGGEAGLQFQSHSANRTSEEELDLNGDGIADGRDVARMTVKGDWRRNWVTDPGIVATLMGAVSADLYDINQDAEYGGTETRLHGVAGVELRWPWVKAGTDGASHVIEPVLQLVTSHGGDGRIPNEDSTLVEFDESNLFAMNRFPGSDAIEQGSWASLGLSYTRYDPTGWSLSFAGGRVIRSSDLDQFSAASGLDGKRSDWLLAWQLGLPDGLSLTNRVLFDDDLKVTKGEWRMDVARDRYSLSSGYVYLIADPDEDRPEQTSELQLDASYDLNPNWTASAMTRYDFDADRATRAGVGLVWRNECVQVDLSLSRRFASSTSVQPTTSFGLSVQLAGFGGGSKAGPAGACRG